MPIGITAKQEELKVKTVIGFHQAEFEKNFDDVITLFEYKRNEEDILYHIIDIQYKPLITNDGVMLTALIIYKVCQI